jgi:uncharacterized membrane protein
MKAVTPEERVVPLRSDHRAAASGEATVIPAIRQVDVEAPWRWIVAGWADLTRMPAISLAYGAVFTAIALGLFAGLADLGMSSLILAFAGGFMLIGPVLAVGLYEGSRRLERGEPIHVKDVVLAGFRAPGQLALLGLALMLTYWVWVHTALLLFMIFMGTQPFPPVDRFVETLLMTNRGVALLTVGTIEGAVLAAVVFATSAISAPMLMDRPVGAAEAILASFRAVQLNVRPMALWAGLIAAFIIGGLLTLSVGLVIAFPLIGHATWHAYRDLTEGEPGLADLSPGAPSA